MAEEVQLDAQITTRTHMVVLMYIVIEDNKAQQAAGFNGHPTRF